MSQYAVRLEIDYPEELDRVKTFFRLILIIPISIILGILLEIDYPDAEKDLDQYLPLFKWLLAIPHYIILSFLAIITIFAVIAAWFIILRTGSYPKEIFYFVEGVIRWGLRVDAYAFLLVTDEYPPFSLN